MLKGVLQYDAQIGWQMQWANQTAITQVSLNNVLHR